MQQLNRKSMDVTLLSDEVDFEGSKMLRVRFESFVALMDVLFNGRETFVESLTSKMVSCLD